MSAGEIVVVAQRCNSASLLVDNKDRWEGIGWGAIFYVSFKRVEDTPAGESLDDFGRRYPLVKVTRGEGWEVAPMLVGADACII